MGLNKDFSKSSSFNKRVEKQCFENLHISWDLGKMSLNLTLNMNNGTFDKLPTNMKIQREFTKDIAETLESIPIEKLEQLLGVQKVKPPSITKPSKWSEFAKRIHQESPLEGVSEDVNKLFREFRDNCSF